MPVIENTLQHTALTQALKILRCNMHTFGTGFPEECTRGNTYHLRQPTQDQPVGANTTWTTGFWTGMLWLAYETTGQEAFAELALQHVQSFHQRLKDRLEIDHHDLGFLYTLSCLPAWRLKQNIQARDTLIEAADHLMTRHLPQAGIIQAWGDLNDPEQQGRMIVDCLLNLPLLFWASEHTGEPRYRQAAESHLEKSAEHLVREDHTTFHTFHFDPQTGRPLHGSTHQGFHHQSCWSRGQAWAMYGFALAYRHTRNPLYLQKAEEVSKVFMKLLGETQVPYWDFSVPHNSLEPRDSSAGAIATCALLELADLTDGQTADQFRQQAQALLKPLIQSCSAELYPGSNALLLHGVYARPMGIGVNEANLWGDYFYLEALVRNSQQWTPYWHAQEKTTHW